MKNKNINKKLIKALIKALVYIIFLLIVIVNYKIIIDKLYFAFKQLNKILRLGYKNNTINLTGFWSDEQRKTHTTCESLKTCLLSYYKKHNINSVLDLGCGTGEYIKFLRKYDINTTGVDNCNICKDIIKHDLTTPYYNKHEYVQSFEVGEHIPKKYENIFIQNICNNATKGIILSWADVGQGGDGHINEKNQKEIIKLIEENGFKLNKNKTNEIRNCIDYSLLYLYFKYNLLIFDKL
jgi:hypothetical protein